ncbi:hypothetical protein [Glycomyces xiaoerkulensis]|uniref:hypothetical protein n=1 Tax=Glycomyces xiaoerkulensis TaxID=2038139 RepID=UPI000C269015|nr:hypothetical protein [Glycomyces xiaoerkulensis]
MTIRHSGVLENTHSAARLAAGQVWNSAQYPPGFGPGEPSYEPAHLRHRPGDDWKIGGRPHDPDDPGPYGTPGWRPDRRIGRHRRGELPDPLPEDRASSTERPQRFSRLREDAYRAFLRDSEELHQAHFEAPEPSLALVRVRWFLRVLLAVLYWRVLPFPERPSRAMRRPSPRPHDRTERRPQVRFETGAAGPIHRPAIGSRPTGRRAIGGRA